MCFDKPKLWHYFDFCHSFTIGHFPPTWRSHVEDWVQDSLGRRKCGWRLLVFLQSGNWQDGEVSDAQECWRHGLSMDTMCFYMMRHPLSSIVIHWNCPTGFAEKKGIAVPPEASEWKCIALEEGQIKFISWVDVVQICLFLFFLEGGSQDFLGKLAGLKNKVIDWIPGLDHQPMV